jgi:hypothetical protein
MAGIFAFDPLRSDSTSGLEYLGMIIRARQKLVHGLRRISTRQGLASRPSGFVQLCVNEDIAVQGWDWKTSKMATRDDIS